MYAGVSEAEKMVIEGGERDEVTREVSVSHTMKQQRDRQTDRQTDRQDYILSLRILMAACSLAIQTLWYEVGSLTQTEALPSHRA